MRLEACALSHAGCVREHNEDAYEIDARRELFVVADGMGGHSHGEIASRLAVDSIHDFVQRTEGEDETWPFPYDARLRRHSNILRAATRQAHQRVLSAIRRDGTLHGMGTTVVACLVREGTAAVAHVGDSRAYRFRRGELELLTADHTWVNEQVIAGYLSLEQARDHPLKNVVTRALGGDSDVQVDLTEVSVEPGDRLLLCTDGLTTMLEDGEIAAHLAGIDEGGPNGACRALVAEANARGGFDNVTVVVLRVES